MRRLAALLLGLLASGVTVAADAVRWREVHADRVGQINADLKSGMPTADVGIYLPENLDPKFAEEFVIEGLLEQFVRSKEVFGVAGVQLNLLWVKTGRIDPAFLEIEANSLVGETPSSDYVNLYVDSRRQASGLSAEAQEAFESIIEKHADNARTVYIVILQNVFMNFFERLDGRTWEQRTITTGGLSFPSYSYVGITKRFRGVITINKNDELRRIMAHELGHKLINVSHEYKEIDPQHEVNAEGGLMLYGSGTDILSGAEGRWHRERLLLSPYLYRKTGKGARQWNPDYREAGHYYDPIYGDKVVQFTPAPPPPRQ